MIVSPTEFDPNFYVSSNPDVAAALADPESGISSALDHFLRYGQFEQRDPNELFDTSYYLENNPDVAAYLASPDAPDDFSAFSHFINNGVDEGEVRAPSAEFASFNAETYYDENIDLQAYYGPRGLGLTGQALDNALFEHFLRYGVTESREGSGTVFEPGGGGTDTTPPTVDVTLADDSLTVGDSTTVTFDFSEVVTGFTLSDVTAERGTLSNLVQDGDDPTVYTATFTVTQRGEASVSVTGAYEDAAGNAGKGAMSDPVTVEPASGGGGGGGGGGSGSGPAPVYSIGDAGAVPEGRDLVFTITRSGDASRAATVFYDVDSTGTSDEDYVQPSGKVTFAAGAATAEIRITTLRDNVVDDYETVTVTLTDVTGRGSIDPLDAVGTGSIDDANTLTVRGNPQDGEYATIQEAVDAAQAGDTIIVTAGEYTEEVIVNKANLTIMGDGTDGSRLAKLNGGIYIESSGAGATISNLNIDGTLDDEGSEGATIFVQADNVTISNNSISSSESSEGTGDLNNNIGIVTSTGDFANLVVTGNTISGFERYGIFTNPTDETGATITSNSFTGNRDGVFFDGGSLKALSGNQFSENTRADISAGFTEDGTYRLSDYGLDASDAASVRVFAQAKVTVIGTGLRETFVQFDDDIGPETTADTFTGGRGADTFVFAAVDTAAGVAADDAVVDTITDFKDFGNADRISFRFDVTNDNYTVVDGNYDTYVEARTAVNTLANPNGTPEVYNARVGADVYLFVDRNGDGDVDEAVRLTGTSQNDVMASDIVNVA